MPDIGFKTSVGSVYAASTDQPNPSRRLRVEESIEQGTYPTGEAIAEPMAVRFDTNGKVVKASAAAAGTADVKGIGLARRPGANYGLTVLKQGVLEGFDLSSLAFGAAVYLSDTPGRLSTAAGTVSVIVGYVEPIHNNLNGGTPGKVLRVKL